MSIYSIINKKQEIIKAAVNWQKTNHMSRTLEYSKCSRDISLVIDSYIYDIINDTVTHTMFIGSRYWARGVRQIRNYAVEFEVHKFVIDYIKTHISSDAELNNRLDGLCSVLLSVIEHGPIIAPSSWQYAYSNRINTYKWSQDAPSAEQIDEILCELHDCAPSKQRRVRYRITVIKNDNPDRRVALYKQTQANPLNITSRYNPQVLAPWVLAFSIRYEGNGENRTKKCYDLESYMDIGIASTFIINSAASKGISSGLCGCIQNKELLINVIGVSPILFVGLGYKESGNTFTCPILNKEVGIPDSDYDQKPSMDVYIKYV